MLGTPLARSLLALVIGLVVVAPVGPAGAENDVRGAHRDRADQHRIVWDEWKRSRKGLHLRSANEDGTDRQRVFDLKAGFTMSLHLDPTGRWVAFAPCCSDRVQPLVVASIDDREILRPLARHRQFYAVGAIGWSRSGERLAFEGFTLRHDTRERALWSVRTDGTGLRRVLELPFGPDLRPDIGDWLAWSRHGILYTDGRDLRAARHGQSSVSVPGVRAFSVSGDGTRMMMARTRGRAIWWVARLDGSDRVPLYGLEDEDTRRSYSEFVLDHDGQEVLASRSTYREETASYRQDLVAFHVGDDLAESRSLGFATASWPITWR